MLVYLRKARTRNTKRANSNQLKKSKKKLAHLYMEKYSFLGVGSEDSSSSSDSES